MNKLPFSKTRVSNGFIFVSGQIPMNKEGEVSQGSIAEQVDQTMENIKEALELEGASLSNIVKTTIYVVDMSTSKEVSDTYVKHLTEPYPVRELVCVKELPLNAQIEISVIAAEKI